MNRLARMGRTPGVESRDRSTRRPGGPEKGARLPANYAHRENHLNAVEHIETDDRSMTIGHLFRTLARYRSWILTAVGGVLFVYTILALAYYLLKPPQSYVALPFRLELQGIEQGQLPNGLRFRPEEIVASPILAAAYERGNLARYMTFQTFTESIFLKESNREMQKVERTYEARLADPKLNPIDRDRLEKEYDLKRNSVVRSDYAVAFVRDSSTDNVPNVVAEKALADILAIWADQAVKRRGVNRYDFPVLGMNILDRSLLNQPDYLVTIDLLRAKVQRILQNIEALSKVPGASTVRTAPPEAISLAELRVRFEDIVRYRIEPLFAYIRSEQISNDPATTVRFLNTQLAHAQIQADATARTAEIFQQALRAYQAEDEAQPAGATGATGTERGGAIAQLGENFLDRLVAMARRAEDLAYRQQLLDRYTAESIRVVPYTAEVAFYTQLLESLGTFSGARPATPQQAAFLDQQLRQSYDDIAANLNRLTAVYQTLSQGLVTGTSVYRVLSPAVERTDRAPAVSLTRLALIGIVIALLTLPIVSALCLLHNGMKEDERRERLAEQVTVA